MKLARVTMRVLKTLIQAATLLVCSKTAFAASSWTFSDGSVSVQGKGSGVGSGLKEKSVYRLTLRLLLT